MKTIYTVYQLNEKQNKLGNPYIGMTYNILQRSKQWKSNLKLDYIPELIVLHTETDGQRCFNWEQNKRVEFGWPRESSYRHQKNMRKKSNSNERSDKQKNFFKSIKTKESQSKAGKIGGKIGGKIVGKSNVESGQLQKAAILGGIVTGNQNKFRNRICKYCFKEGKHLSIIAHERYCKIKPLLHLESRPI